MTPVEEMPTRKEEITLYLFLISMAAFTFYCGWIIYSSWRWVVF